MSNPLIIFRKFGTTTEKHYCSESAFGTGAKNEQAEGVARYWDSNVALRGKSFFPGPLHPYGISTLNATVDILEAWCLCKCRASILEPLEQVLDPILTVNQSSAARSNYIDVPAQCFIYILISIFFYSSAYRDQINLNSEKLNNSVFMCLYLLK